MLVDNRDGFESCSRLRGSITESKVLLWRSLKHFEVLLAISPNTTRHLSSQLGSSEGSSTYLSITRYGPNSNWLKFMQSSGVSKMQEVWQVRLIACETAVSTLHSWCKGFLRFLMVSLYPKVIFQPKKSVFVDLLNTPKFHHTPQHFRETLGLRWFDMLNCSHIPSRQSSTNLPLVWPSRSTSRYPGSSRWYFCQLLFLPGKHRRSHWLGRAARVSKVPH